VFILKKELFSHLCDEY